MTLNIGPHVKFIGSLTFPVELSRSPESMWNADRESQVSLQGKQAAWDPAWLLSQPMCYSETCQLQFRLFFFPSGEICCQKFPASSALCCYCCSKWESQNGPECLTQGRCWTLGALAWQQVCSPGCHNPTTNALPKCQMFPPELRVRVHSSVAAKTVRVPRQGLQRLLYNTLVLW